MSGLTSGMRLLFDYFLEENGTNRGLRDNKPGRRITEKKKRKLVEISFKVDETSCFFFCLYIFIFIFYFYKEEYGRLVHTAHPPIHYIVNISNFEF